MKASELVSGLRGCATIDELACWLGMEVPAKLVKGEDGAMRLEPVPDPGVLGKLMALLADEVEEALRGDVSRDEGEGGTDAHPDGENAPESV